jgi:imidazolonepropionase-like amidohydrolase
VFQLDQLGAAVLSPVRAAVKNQKEAVRASEIGERAHVAVLIGEREIRDSFTRFRAGLVVIVGGLKVFGVQLGRDGFASRAQPTEFAHDGGLFSQVFGNLVARGHLPYSTANAVWIRDEVFERAEYLARRTHSGLLTLFRDIVSLWRWFGVPRADMVHMSGMPFLCLAVDGIVDSKKGTFRSMEKYYRMSGIHLGHEVHKMRFRTASRLSRFGTFPQILVLVCIVTVVGQNASAVDDAATTVIRDVTVISPERSAPLEHAYVRIQGGRIVEVGSRLLKGEVQIDGRGRFLIPGLIDTHVHLTQVPGMEAPQRSARPDLAALAAAQEPRSYLYFGFTTVLSLGDATASFVEQWNALAVRPDAYFCGSTPIVSGYSFQGFVATPYFLFNAGQAGTIPASVDKTQHTPDAVVQQMSRDGAICVKSYRESGFGDQAGRLPVPTVEMMRAVVAAAHARGMPVFLHANSKEAQEFALQAGVDVIAHGMWNGHQSTATVLDKSVEPILQEIVKRGIGYQPTAQVIRGLGAEPDDQFFADPLLSRVYPPQLIAWYRSPEGSWFRKELGDAPPDLYERVGASGDAVTGYLARNHARLLFGTDTPSAPIYTNPPGLNGLYEMRRWVAAGVSTRQLFQALTLDNARILHRDRDIGSIEKGKRAHLLLLRANPLDNVEAYNAIETVFLSGKAIPREMLAAPGN